MIATVPDLQFRPAMVGIPPRLDKEPPAFWIFDFSDGQPILEAVSENEFHAHPERCRFFGTRSEAAKFSKELLEKALSDLQKVVQHSEKSRRASKIAAKKKSG